MTVQTRNSVQLEPIATDGRQRRRLQNTSSAACSAQSLSQSRNLNQNAAHDHEKASPRSSAHRRHFAMSNSDSTGGSSEVMRSVAEIPYESEVVTDASKKEGCLSGALCGGPLSSPKTDSAPKPSKDRPETLRQSSGPAALQTRRQSVTFDRSAYTRSASDGSAVKHRSHSNKYANIHPATEKTPLGGWKYPPNAVAEAFKTIFAEFDHDQDGLLLPEQLTEALRYLRIDVNSKVLQEIMSFLKISEKSAYDFDDFLVLAHNTYQLRGETDDRGNSKPMKKQDSIGSRQSLAVGRLRPLDSFTSAYVDKYDERCKAIRLVKKKVEKGDSLEQKSLKDVDSLLTTMRESQHQASPPRGNSPRRGKSPRAKSPRVRSSNTSSESLSESSTNMSQASRASMRGRTKLPAYSSVRLYLGRKDVTHEESRGGTWKEPTTEKVMITTNPSRLSRHKPFDRLSFTKNAKIRKHVEDELKSFHRMRRQQSNIRFISDWVNMDPHYITPKSLNDRFRLCFSVYSGIEPHRLPTPHPINGFPLQKRRQSFLLAQRVSQG